MDAFAEFDFLCLGEPSAIPMTESARDEEGTLRPLVDADTRLGYGGYCVIA
uniref:Pheromone receptor n=1 Tax=Cyclocybe aegerita TaxID=1973307 RepID=A0A3S7H362_CYCAE|nr:pheromone receptor [Cyclocybe aegerita]